MAEPLLPKNRNNSLDEDGCGSFQSHLRWICLDQSDSRSTFVSLVVCLVFAVFVPAFSHFYLPCDAEHCRPFSTLIELSLSSVAILSFFSLSFFFSDRGLRNFLLLDKLDDDTDVVRQQYIDEVNKSLKTLSYFVLPCFVAKCAHKIWWYASGASEIPFLGNILLSNIVACSLELISWLYRTSVFFFMCIIFRLLCDLQILRLEEFAKFFRRYSDVKYILKEDCRIKRDMEIINLSFCPFLSLSLIMITLSQLAGLRLTTKLHSHHTTIFIEGEFALCSMTLVSGLWIMLANAASITHRAQAITSSVAARWHACVTVYPHKTTSQAESGESNANGPFFNDCISLQERQALVNYFEHNIVGITICGVTLQATWLRVIYSFELYLTFLLLQEIITIS